MIKYFFLLVGFFVISLLFLYRKKVSTAQVFHFVLGKYKISALLDGYFDFNFENIIKEDVFLEHLYSESGILNSPVVPINVYVVNTGNKIILIDVGLAGYKKSATGFLMEALEHAGYQPEQVTDILITHLHLDHIAGLLTKDGQKAFPNAQLYISKEDIAYSIYDQKLDPALSSLMTKLIVPYALHAFTQNQTLFEGVSVISTPGHSVGHSSFLFESEAQKFFVWGDIVNIPELQFMYSKIALRDDIDNLLAAKTKNGILERMVKENILIGGLHLPFPGLGYVQKSLDQAGYVFEPLSDPSFLE